MKLYSCFIQFYSFKQFCSILSFQTDFISIPNVVFQSLSCVWLFVTPWSAACQVSLSFTISLSWLKLMSIESVMPSNHLIFSHLLIPLPSIFPSIRICSNKLILVIKWLKYWRFSFGISPCNDYVGLISFRIDWFNLLAVQGTLKTLLQHQSSKTSIFQCSAFFMVQLWHLYMTTGKTIALTIWTFAGKVMFLFFNILSRSVIAFLPRGKPLLIWWLQSPSTVILLPLIELKLQFEKCDTYSDLEKKYIISTY